MKKIFLFLFIIWLISGLSAQSTSNSILYGGQMDEIISDAIKLANGEVLIIANADSLKPYSKPLAITVDSHLNIKSYTINNFNINIKLRMLMKAKNNVYILASVIDSSNNKMLLLELQNNDSFNIVDSLSLDVIYPSFRNYRYSNNNLFIIGDGSSINDPRNKNFFILSFDVSQGKLYFREFDLPGFQAGLDIFCQKDSSFIIASLDERYIVQICSLSKRFSIENFYSLPFKMYLNAKILSANDTNVIMSGRTKKMTINTSYYQLVISSLKFGSDTLALLDSVLFGKERKDEIPAYRGVSGAQKHFYIGGTSGFDGETYPFSPFENNYIIASITKKFRKRFTKYIGLKNHFLFLTKSVILEDGSILLIGTAYDFTNETNERQRDIYIVKLDSSGNIATGLPPEILPENDFLLYPNPGTNYLQVSLPNASSGRFALYDMQGRLIEWQLFRQHLQINTAGLPAGIYIYRISDEKERTHYGKWVKQ